MSKSTQDLGRKSKTLNKSWQKIWFSMSQSEAGLDKVFKRCEKNSISLSDSVRVRLRAARIFSGFMV
jgi:hypothetical protein